MKKRNLLYFLLLVLLAVVSGCNHKRNSNGNQDGIEIENPSMEDGLEVSEINEDSYAYFDNLDHFFRLERKTFSNNIAASDDESGNSVEKEVEALGVPEDMLAYWKVLNSRQSFVSTDEGYQEFYWNEYNWSLGRLVERRQADCFMIVDMNGDGAKEIVLDCTPESVQVLHYEDGTVYSYQFVYRGMKRIHNNGIYEGSNGAASTAYLRLTSLNKDGYTEEILAQMDDDYYEVEGEEADSEEFSEYADTIESVELAECMEFTEDMIDRQLLGDLSEQEIALETYPSHDSYWNDSLVLLNQLNKNVCLYGININGQTAMLLSIEGEKVLIEEDPFPSFQNLYQELSNLNVSDVDGDGADEVLISLRTVTGSPVSRYAMLVCDREDEWNIYMYSDYLEDVEDLIQYRYDDENNSITFLDNKDHILWEGKLPEWTKEYAYTGTVNLGDQVSFNAETFQMEIVPEIELENSLPYEPVKITFDLGFKDGEFKIEGYDMNDYRVIEEGENQS